MKSIIFTVGTTLTAYNKTYNFDIVTLITYYMYSDLLSTTLSICSAKQEFALTGKMATLYKASLVLLCRTSIGGSIPYYVYVFD